jgi:hypothetical protein
MVDTSVYILSYEKSEMRQQLGCAGEIDLKSVIGCAYVIKERNRRKRYRLRLTAAALLRLFTSLR